MPLVGQWTELVMSDKLCPLSKEDKRKWLSMSTEVKTTHINGESVLVEIILDTREMN